MSPPIDASGARIAAFIESATAPSHIAVGEGAVWMLNTENQTVSRVDPETKAVTGRFEPPGVPSDIAAGAGALWVGLGGGDSANYTLRGRPDRPERRPRSPIPSSCPTGPATPVSRRSTRVTATSPSAPAPSGRTTPTTRSRGSIPPPGRLVATIDVETDEIAADAQAVWVVNGPVVTRIDPRTNRVAQRIRLATTDTSSIAVGAGKVWVTDSSKGAVWRIEPGPRPITRAIAVGPGVTYVAYGAGAAWAGNYIDGTVSRIDARTGKVTRVAVGAVQALAAGAGGAWASTAGRPRGGTLPAALCGELVAGGEEPDVLITSDLPLQGPDGAGPRAMADAIRLVLKQRNFTAGKYAVGYHSCDESTAQTGAFEQRRCAANAHAYAGAKRLVAVIGPWSSFCAEIQIPILNRAPGEPLAMISPTNSAPGLTRQGPPPPDGLPGEPEVYYPTGVRNYVRVFPGDDLQGAAHAVLAKRLGLERVYLLSQRSSFWDGLLTDPFRRAARRLGVGVAGSASFDPQAKSFDALADTVARSGADGVVVGGDPYDGGDRLVKALRARLGARVHDHGRLLLHAGRCARAHGQGGARDVRDDARPAARHASNDRRGPPLRARHRRARHGVPGCAGGRPGRRARARRDRALRRNPRRRCASSCRPARSRTASSAASASTPTAT